MKFDREKIIAEGGKYHGPDDMLVECAPFTVTSTSMQSVADTGNAPSYIKEDANLPKRMVIEGVFQRAGVKNANGRVYPKTLWERLLHEESPVMKRVKDRAMIGHIEHPENGTTDLKQGAILVTDVWMESDGTVRGRAIIYNNANGLLLQEYIATGTKLGISSRGTGTVDSRGQVCEDFALETWDMVYNPSTPGANPSLKTESVDSHPTKTPVVENQSTSTIMPTQVHTMSISKRIAEARESVAQLLAIDPKRLTVESRTKLANDLLDARVRIAEAFQGEQRTSEVSKLLENIDAARKVAEGDMGVTDAPVGDDMAAPTVAGLFDPITKAINAAGAAKQQAMEQVKALSNLIAANLTQASQIHAVAESVIAGKKFISEEKHDELKSLLVEARDEIINLTERVEAATAISTALTEQARSLKGERDALALSESKALTALSELSGKAAQKPVEESKSEEAAKVVESAPKDEPAKPKPLSERLAEIARKRADESALPAAGSNVASKPDAVQVDAKTVIVESAAPRKHVGASMFKAASKAIRSDLGTVR